MLKILNDFATLCPEREIIFFSNFLLFFFNSNNRHLILKFTRIGFFNFVETFNCCLRKNETSNSVPAVVLKKHLFFCVTFHFSSSSFVPLFFSSSGFRKKGFFHPFLAPFVLIYTKANDGKIFKRRRG